MMLPYQGPCEGPCNVYGWQTEPNLNPAPQNRTDSEPRRSHPNPGLASSAANNPGPGRVRPRGPWRLLWHNRVKTAPPKPISFLFFCPLRVLWEKYRLVEFPPLQA